MVVTATNFPSKQASRNVLRGEKPPTPTIRVIGYSVYAAKDLRGAGFAYAGPPTGFVGKGRNLIFLRHTAAPDQFEIAVPVYATAIPLSDSRPYYPKTEGILESSLYVTDVARSAQFYIEIFGFRVISDFGEHGCAMGAGHHRVLLLFKKGGSRAMQSPHDGDGELHLAFAIRADELAGWEAWLAENGITVEEKRKWELGAKASIFATLTGI